MRPEDAQKAHYDLLAEHYDAHYDDEWTRKYRDRFIDPLLLAGLDLRGRAVLEVMCGSGLTTRALLARGARVTGLDVSETAIARFRQRWPQCSAVQASVTDSGLPSASFDAAVVVAGLHHAQPSVEAAFSELHRVLKPGGMLCFMEPHRGSLANWFRRLWYRWDPLFLPNEEALDLRVLTRQWASRFAVVRESYGGNIAFLVVANSLVFRVPLRWKAIYSPPLLGLEAAIARAQPAALACFVICQWRRAADRG